MSSSATATQTSNEITLKGSTAIVCEFFNYSVNTILYQRGIYPPENFKREKCYNLPLMVTTDEGLGGYMRTILKQMEDWLNNGKVQKLVLVVKGTDSGESLERWVFKCECKQDLENQPSNEIKSEKSPKEIANEIQALIRQITASVSFLPLLNEACCFDLLIYADKDATVPVSWEDSDPCFIANAEEVKLRSFDTNIHKVDLAVSYRIDDDGI